MHTPSYTIPPWPTVEKFKMRAKTFLLTTFRENAFLWLYKLIFKNAICRATMSRLEVFVWFGLSVKSYVVSWLCDLVSREENVLLALCSSRKTRQKNIFRFANLKIKLGGLLVLAKDFKQILGYLFPRPFLPVMKRGSSPREKWAARNVKPNANSFEKAKKEKACKIW